MRLKLRGFLLALAGAACAPAAYAKAAAESAQSYERAWNTAVRYVRVDQNLKVTEKDIEAGYVAFDYVSSDSAHATSPGTLELVRLDGGKVRIVVQLSKMPRFHEDVFLQGVLKKLREDYGDSAPPPPPPTKPAPAPPSTPSAPTRERGANDL